MKIASYLMVAIIFLCTSCEKEKINIDENLEAFEKLDGTYKIVSAFGDKPYDVNLDGSTDINLMNEIPNLANSSIDIVVKKNLKTFRLLWAEQYILFKGDIPTPQYSYIMQGEIDRFEIDQNFERIHVQKSIDTDSRFNPPNLIDISAKDKISIELLKTIATSKGEQLIKINATYEKAGSQGVYN
jgi:hypothetical protein